MSISVMTEVWKDAPVSGTQLLMLLALADSCNDDRECWPSVRHLQHKVRVSEPQARKLLKQLELQGLIEVGVNKGKGAKGRESNLYHICPMTPITQDTSTPITQDTLNHHIEPSLKDIASDDAVKISHTAKSTVPAVEMNPMKDAIARAFRYDWKTMTKSEIGLVQKAARELCLANVTADDIPALYAYCAANFTNFKAMALPGNLSAWRKTLPSPSNIVTALDLSKWTSESIAHLEGEQI